MKRIFAQLFITLTIWWLTGITFLISLSQTPYIGLFEVMLMFGLFIVPAVLSTIIVWSPHLFNHPEQQAIERVQVTTPKRKNSSAEDQRLNTLLALMDEDERKAFKEALKDQYLSKQTKRKNQLIDGELPFDAEEYDDDLIYNQR